MIFPDVYSCMNNMQNWFIPFPSPPKVFWVICIRLNPCTEHNFFPDNQIPFRIIIMLLVLCHNLSRNQVDISPSGISCIVDLKLVNLAISQWVISLICGFFYLDADTKRIVVSLSMLRTALILLSSPNNEKHSFQKLK